MYFLDKRIKGICEELKKLRVRQNLRIEDWKYREGKFLYIEEANLGEFAPFTPNMHWYGPDKHYWFKTTLIVPESFAGKPLWLNIKTNIDEWDDAKNPQFLLFVDGEIFQGIDMNHRDVLLTKQAKVGHVYDIQLQAHTGILHTEFQFIAYMQEIDAEIEALYYDLWVPWAAFARMDKDSLEYMALERELNNAINLLDLRTPYSEAFYSSVKEARTYLAENLYGKLGGYADVVASCIGHTHIDVAWWWTVEQTREKVARSFATVLRYLEEYPNYRFMSSQPQLYAMLKERYPEVYAKVKEQVKAGNWEPEGGMWLESDTNLTSGESLVRQFLHGKRFFQEEFGVDNKILWLPDVFGYSGALPQILKKSGIDYFMTTKLNWNQFNKMPHDTFIWRGIDGSEVFTHLITTLGVNQPIKDFFTTYNGMLHPDALIGAWQRYQDKQMNNDVLISYGYGDGGGGPTREMIETSIRMEKGVKGLPKVRQCFTRTYFDELHDRVKDHPRLATWEGELYFEYHRGTLTSMARNKRSNRKSELALMDLELLSVLAEPAIAYPTEPLDRIWKVVLLNQFHDILPGSSIHEVYEVSKREYSEIAEEMQALQVERLQKLIQPSEEITVFNTKGCLACEYVNLGKLDATAVEDAEGNVFPVQQTAEGALAYVKRIPPKGYKTLKKSTAPAQEVPFVVGKHSFSSPYYEVEFDEYGQFSRLYDKKNDREVLQVGKLGNVLRMYEDKPIYYDNWDIDIFYTEKFWDATDLSTFEWQEVGTERATLYIERKISNSVIRQRIHFYAKSRRIDFVNHVDWKEHQHLLKVHFPVNVHTDEATFDIQFGNLKRKTHTNTSWDVARFESCGQKWVDLSEGNYGVSLLNDCKYGHSVKDSNIGLSLIKSGIEPNPVTDQEEHFFTYALYPHAGDWRAANTIRAAYKLNQPSFAVQGSGASASFSLLSVDQDNVIVETVKKAEDGRGIIVRLYEGYNALTKAKLTWNSAIQKVEECNLMEEKLADIAHEGNVFAFQIKPYEVKTYRIMA